MQVRNIGIIDNSYRSNLSNNTAAQTMKEPTEAGSFRRTYDKRKACLLKRPNSMRHLDDAIRRAYGKRHPPTAR